LLVVERDDIVFGDGAPGMVDIAITVRNDGDEWSAPTEAEISAAPLGAFVAWQPLATVTVPALAPGDSTVLHLQARRPKTAPLGPPDRVPPRRLLTALANDDPSPGRRSRLRRQDAANPLTLPRDVFGMLWEENPYWAGNLNIFVGRTSVERHLAQALRVYPERVNLAMFVVGSGRDSYKFVLEGAAAAWDAKLYDTTESPFIGLSKDNKPLAQNRWVKVRHCSLVFLAMRPPRGATEAKLDVHVTQRSTGESAVVEFSLDADAVGAGCYVVG
jgi:hypothetical protein